MARHLERYGPQFEPRDIRVGKHVMDCYLGLPPPGMEINPNAVQLNTGIASGPTVAMPFAAGLNHLGYATIIVSPHTPGTHNHEDTMRVSEKVMEGELGFDPTLLSYVPHSLGQRDTILGIIEFADDELLDHINNVIAVSPVGYRGVQGVVGAARTLTHDVFSLRYHRHLLRLGGDALKYTGNAGIRAPLIVREARGCDLIEPTKAIIARGIGVGAVLGRYDNMIHHNPSLEGLHEAGVTVTESVPTDHLGILLQWEETLAAGLRVRDALDKERAERESKKSA